MPKVDPFQDVSIIHGPIFDRRRDGLYDRLVLKAGKLTPPEIVCFQRSVGPLVDWTETNMLEAGFLPAPYDAIICRFLFLFQPSCSDEDVALFLRNYIWEFWILQKCLGRQPALLCAAKGDMRELVEGFGGVDCNGKVRPYARAFSFTLGTKYAIYLPSLGDFKLKLIGKPVMPRHDLDFYPILDGTIDRPIQ